MADETLHKTKGSGLQRRLLFSHLSIAGIGLGLLVASSLSILSLRSNAVRLARDRAPSAQKSVLALSGIHQSLAALRSWVVLGKSDFKEERKQAWQEKIQPSFTELEALSREWNYPQNKKKLRELRPLVRRLEGLQWWIEDVAQTPGNEPAQLLFEQNIRPVYDRIFSLVTEMIDEEKEREEAGLERKLLVASLADFRGMLAYAEKLLSHFIRGENKEIREDEFHQYLNAAQRELQDLTAQKDIMTRGQRRLIAQIEWEFQGFKVYAGKAIELRKSEKWNIAEHMLETRAVPLEKKVTRLLADISSSQETLMQRDSTSSIRVSDAAVQLSLGLILVMAVTAIFLSRRATQKITDPILAIARASQELLEGTLSTEVPITQQVEKGELTGAFHSMRLALEQSYITLRKQAKELEESNKELEQFAYVASHDLQEPLRKITSFAGLLMEKDREKLDEESQHYIERMSDSASRMKRLIEDLLEFSRVSRTKKPFESVSLDDVIRDVLSDLEVRIQESDSKVEVDPLPVIDGDPSQMRQLFQNLIGNALKYRKKEEPPHVTLRCLAGEAFYEISVEDNGIGFDEQHKDKIFEPFQRLHTREEYEGTGIGLSICKKIVERHGGAIAVHSEIGKGSIFTIKLPKPSSPA